MLPGQQRGAGRGNLPVTCSAASSTGAYGKLGVQGVPAALGTREGIMELNFV
jgi:hypothetical protein